MGNDEDSFFNRALGIAILTTLIMLTITTFFQPIIFCFIDTLKRLLCPCCYDDMMDEDDIVLEPLTTNDNQPPPNPPPNPHLNDNPTPNDNPKKEEEKV